MNRTALKLIACLTMLIDHMGLLLFPEALWMRCIGRLAMPLFAFFIAEGARYTSHKLRYFLQIFLLGVACQSVYIIEQLISGFVYSYYFNILLTFSFSLILCFAYLRFEKASEAGDRTATIVSAILFFLSLALAVGLCFFFDYIESQTYYEVTFDYGLPGILLPLAAVIAKDKNQKFLFFSTAILLFCVVSMAHNPIVWFALLDIPLLALYNGKKGRTKFKYGFYLFYPLHLALLYLLQILIK